MPRTLTMGTTSHLPFKTMQHEHDDEANAEGDDIMNHQHEHHLGNHYDNRSYHSEPVTPEETHKKIVSWKGIPESPGAAAEMQAYTMRSLCASHSGPVEAKAIGKDHSTTPPESPRLSHEDDRMRQKMSRRSQQRSQKRHKSSLSPLDGKSGNSNTSCSKPRSLEVLQFQIQHLERKIHKAARTELALLNKAMQLREKRRVATERYGQMAHEFENMLQVRNPAAEAKDFITPRAFLPPLMPAATAVPPPNKKRLPSSS